MGKPRSAPHAAIPVTGLWIRSDPRSGDLEVLFESGGVWFVAFEITRAAIVHQLVSKITEIPDMEKARPDPLSGIIVE